MKGETRLPKLETVMKIFSTLCVWYMHTHVYMWVKARSQCQASSSIVLLFVLVVVARFIL